MVSTRGVKLKFSENERVLCYEPDPTKAKVLYDSKVLDVVINKDQRGRKSVEYLIHFQGWNSSWDRCVSEEYVLKDTPENRQLQKDLAEKSQLQLGAYLYRRERKKHSRKISERVPPSSDDCSSGSPTRMDTDEVSSSTEEESSGEDDSIHIELPRELRHYLELDYNLINTKKKILKVPAEPNVVNILEIYWRHYATQQICDFKDKPNTRHKFPYNNQIKRRPEDIQKNLNICKEILDGLRIYFDFTLNELLLYKNEINQIDTIPALFKLQLHAKDDLQIKNENNYVGYSNQINSTSDVSSMRKRTLRSNKSTDQNIINGDNCDDTLNTKNLIEINNDNNLSTNSFMKTMSWRLLPENVYHQQPSPPCLIYGAIHLVRLFVKLPDLLNSSNIDDVKLKILLEHIDIFIDFLNEQKEWFGEKFYIEKI